MLRGRPLSSDKEGLDGGESRSKTKAARGQTLLGLAVSTGTMHKYTETKEVNEDICDNDERARGNNSQA